MLVKLHISFLSIQTHTVHTRAAVKTEGVNNNMPTAQYWNVHKEENTVRGYESEIWTTTRMVMQFLWNPPQVSNAVKLRLIMEWWNFGNGGCDIISTHFLCLQNGSYNFKVIHVLKSHSQIIDCVCRFSTIYFCFCFLRWRAVFTILVRTTLNELKHVRQCEGSQNRSNRR